MRNKLSEKLAAIVIKDLIRKFNLKHLDSVILGNAVGPGGNVARLSSLKVGLDVPAFTIDVQCASALKSIEVAYTQIASGLSEIIIAGGIESTSMSPIIHYSKNDPRKTKDKEFYKVAQFTMVILCSERGIKKILNNVYIELEEELRKNYNLKELKKDTAAKSHEIFEVKGFCNISGDGNLSPENGVKVAKKLMSNFNLTYDDIDAFEINGAFAVITALFQEEFGSREKLNRFGGALAYGHPYGASGGIITLHLIEILKHFNGRKGIVAIPAAGGLGEAMLLERIDLKYLD